MMPKYIQGFLFLLCLMLFGFFWSGPSDIIKGIKDSNGKTIEQLLKESSVIGSYKIEKIDIKNIPMGEQLGFSLAMQAGVFKKIDSVELNCIYKKNELIQMVISIIEDGDSDLLRQLCQDEYSDWRNRASEWAKRYISKNNSLFEKVKSRTVFCIIYSGDDKREIKVIGTEVYIKGYEENVYLKDKMFIDGLIYAVLPLIFSEYKDIHYEYIDGKRKEKIKKEELEKKKIEEEEQKLRIKKIIEEKIMREKEEEEERIRQEKIAEEEMIMRDKFNMCVEDFINSKKINGMFYYTSDNSVHGIDINLIDKYNIVINRIMINSIDIKNSKKLRNRDLKKSVGRFKISNCKKDDSDIQINSATGGNNSTVFAYSTLRDKAQFSNGNLSNIYSREDTINGENATVLSFIEYNLQEITGKKTSDNKRFFYADLSKRYIHSLGSSIGIIELKKQSGYYSVDGFFLGKQPGQHAKFDAVGEIIERNTLQLKSTDGNIYNFKIEEDRDGINITIPESYSDNFEGKWAGKYY